MKGALAIAAAEIRQHRLVIWAGLLLGCLPLVLHLVLHGVPMRPFAPGLGARQASDPVWATAVNLSLAVAFGLGLVGVSRDLSERRLGFYLARPLSLFQYWAGKVGAAFLLSVAAAALVLSPAHLVGSMSWTATGATLAHGWRVWLGGISFALAAGSAAGGAFRARSGLLVLDIVMLPLTSAAVVFAFARAWEAGTGEVVMLFGLPWLGAAATLVLLAAGAAQICAGRLDRKRGHALLSAIAWGGLWFFFVGGMLGGSRFVASATPADLRLPHNVSFHGSRAGTHVMLEGPSTRWTYPYRYVPGFLLNAQGEFIRLGGFERLSGWAWSADSRHVAWSKEDPSAGLPVQAKPPFASSFDPSILVLSLGEPGAVPRRLTRGRSADVRAISPSGERVLVRTAHGREVIEISTGRAVAKAGDRLDWPCATFVSENSVRALRADRERSTVLDWDLAGGPVVERGTFFLKGDGAGLVRLVPADDWQRVLRFDGSGLFLHDLDGRVVATLVDGWSTRRNRAAGALSAGRWGAIEEEPEGLRLRVFDRQGRQSAEARFKARFPLRVGGESAIGLLALGVSPFSKKEDQPATLFVDLGTGSLMRREAGLSPALRRWEPGREGDTENPEPATFSTRLFLSDDGQLVILDPATGSRRVLVTRRQ